MFLSDLFLFLAMAASTVDKSCNLLGKRTLFKLPNYKRCMDPHHIAIQQKQSTGATALSMWRVCESTTAHAFAEQA